MSDFFVDQIFDGSIILASLVAALAGLISFLSPCVLPLVPGYLSYVSGTVNSKVRIVLGTALFILGFSILFISYGALFGGLGSWILERSTLITKILGLITILLGVIFVWSSRFYRSWKFTSKAGPGLVGAPILGFMFGLGWTPCIGPTLGAVQTLALIESSATRGAILSFAYCIGLGGPFLLFAFFLEKSSRVRTMLIARSRIFQILGGVLLIAIGILQITGIWETMMINLRGTIAEFVPVL